MRFCWCNGGGGGGWCKGGGRVGVKWLLLLLLLSSTMHHLALEVIFDTLVHHTQVGGCQLQHQHHRSVGWRPLVNYLINLLII